MNLEPLRKLGNWETFCKLSHQYYERAGMVMQYARVCGPLTGDLVFKALKSLWERHPLLRASFGPKVDGKSCFIFQDCHRDVELPFRVVDRQSEFGWQSFVDLELTRDFEGDLLWRGALFLDPNGQEHDLVFFFIHSITDGLSNTYMINDLLILCRQLHEGREPPSEHEQLLPPIEDMIPLQGTPLEAPKWTKLETEPWPFQAFAPIPERRTRCRYFTIEQNLFAQIVSRCRSNGASVNSLLMAAFLQTLAEEWLDWGDAINLIGTSALSMRDQCKPPIDNSKFGCYAMALQTTYTLARDQSLMDLARQCRKRLGEHIAWEQSKGFLSSDFTEDGVLENIHELIGSLNRSRTHNGGPGLSNLGVLDFPDQYGPFSIKAMHFTTVQPSGFYPACINALTLRDDFYFCFAHTEPLIPSYEAIRIAEIIYHKLIKC